MTKPYQARQKAVVDQLRIDRPTEVAAPVSVVPLRADYRSDPALGLTSVVFVPAALAAQIEQRLIEPLRRAAPHHYYYPPEALHLTIKNVRRIHHPPRFTPAIIRRVKRLFARLIPQHAPFPIKLTELVPLASSLSLIGYCDERLARLVLALDQGLKSIGLPDDKQYISNEVFFGNITICRYVHPPEPAFLEAVAALRNAYQANLLIKTIHLITTTAVCRPETRQIHGVYTLQNG